MPNYTDADRIKAQVRSAEMFASHELRASPPVTFMEFKKQTETSVPSHKETRLRADSPVAEINFKNRVSRVLGTAGETYDHTGVKGDSSIVTPTWIKRDDDFNWSLKQADKSVFSLIEELAHEFGQMSLNFSEGLETLATSTLFAARSGVNIATVEGAFDDTDDIFQITNSTHGDRIAQITKMVMQINKYKGHYTFFCDPVAFNLFEYKLNQGVQNSENLSFQFGNITFVNSLELQPLFGAVDAGYVLGNWLVVPDNALAVLDWIPQQNRMGVDNPGINKYYSFPDPITGLTMGFHEYQTRADDTANGGHQQDVVTQVQEFIHLAFEVAPLTTATETPVMAFSLIT